jgi:hypothetical protein
MNNNELLILLVGVGVIGFIVYDQSQKQKQNQIQITLPTTQPTQNQKTGVDLTGLFDFLDFDEGGGRRDKYRELFQNFSI